MERKIEKFLQKWQKDIIRKPLILYGPKQVGKSYSALDFGKTNYKNTIYFNSVKEALEDLGAEETVLRKAEKKDGPVITENGNVILDTKFVEIYDGLEEDIKSIVGVIESGLFMDYSVEIIKPEERKD